MAKVDGWILDRIDFVPPGTRCHRRNCPLRSGVAYVARGPNGHLRYYGETCAEHDFGAAALQGVPDLTSRTAAAEVVAGGGRGGAGGGVVDPALQRLARAKGYLILRCELLGRLPGIHEKVKDERLEAHYEKYLEVGDITGPQVDDILAIEKNLPAKFQFINLIDVHTAVRQLHAAIAKADGQGNQKEKKGNDWPRIILQAVVTKLRLTEPQMAAGKLSLHKSAFADV